MTPKSLSLLAVAAILVAPAGARAETFATCTGFIDSLPATLTTQGTWCLRKDLSTAITSGPAILVATNNVTVDCNGFKVGGLAAGDGTTASGVYTFGRSNVVVRNCNIRGFGGAISFDDNPGGGGFLVEDNLFDGNTLVGISVSGFNSVIRRNRIFDTGGSSVSTNATGIIASRDVLMQDNIIHGVYPSFVQGANSYAWGIRVIGSDYALVKGNKITYVDDAAFSSVGIEVDGTRTVVQGNHVGTEASIGIRCLGLNAGSSVALDNTVLGANLAIANCRDDGNTVD